MQIWNYYLSGILRCKFKFDDMNILVSERNIKEYMFIKYLQYGDELKKELKITLPLEFIHSFYNTQISDVTNLEVSGKTFFRKNNNLWIQTGYVMNPLDFITNEKGKIICFMINNGYFSEYLILEGCEENTPLLEWNEVKEYADSIEILEDVMVEMRDGVRLATDIYLPGNLKNDKIETILIRTPYGKKRTSYRDMMYSYRGYAVVIQDVRGRENSEGEFIGMYYEKNDGSDTVDWIVNQPWSNGKVGTIGGSYGGYVQWALASSGNKHLKAMISQVTSGSPFTDIERRNGTYHMGIMDWNMMMAGKTVDWNCEDIDWNKVKIPTALKNLPENLGKNIKFWDEYIKHECQDEFWDEMTFNKEISKNQIPCLYLSGWHDGDILGTMEVWELNKHKENQRLIIGPWIHNFNSLRKVIDVDLGQDAILYNLDLLYLKWFDKFLKEKDVVLKTDGAQFYAEYKNKWFTDETFPPKNAEEIEFYLNKIKDEQKLTVEMPTEKLNFEYEYDPSNPAPQLKDQATKKINVPIDYKEVEDRKDVLSFTTDVFTEDKILACKPIVKIFASSSAIDTDWVVRLTKVDREGKSRRIADGIVRAKFYKSYREINLLNPNQIYCYEIPMQYSAVEIKKGEALRLEITSSQFGEIFPNTNTGKDAAYDSEYIIAHQKIYVGETFNSSIKLNFLREDCD